MRGQATVEFAMLLPFFLMCLGLIVCTAFVCLETLHLNDTARVIARAVATSDDPQLTAKNMAPSSIKVLVQTHEITGVLTVSLHQQLRIPIIGALPVVSLHATSHILQEAAPVFAR